jgi:hypothetical protein
MDQIMDYEEAVSALEATGNYRALLGLGVAIFAQVRLRQHDEERFLKKTLLHLPGVVGVNSSFALKTVKLTTDLPV